MKVRYTFIMLATVLGLICSAQVQAQQVESFVADVTVSEEAVAFAIDGQYVGFVMTVSGPDAFYLERRFASDETPMLKAVSQEGTLADGPYNFEITAQPFLPEAARAELDKARAANDRAALQRQFTAAGVSPYAMVYTVTVGIAEGKFLNPVEEDDTAGQELGTNAKPGVVPGSIRLTGRRYQPDYQFAGQGAVAAPDATGAALQAVAQQNETLPPFGQHPATSADIWHEVMFENTAPDGTPLQFQGYVRPVMVNGGQILQAYFRELRPDDTTPDVWQPGFFRADESGFSLLALADVVQQATAAPLFDYVTDDAPMTEEEAAMRDQVFFDDIIVVGSACVGQDCSNGESFGFDTLRLKENNLRIKAQDTSNSASFPTVDWQITFNDSSNGGQNKFAIDNIDGGRTPFTILDGAPSHSLYVDAQGDVGVGTSTPVVELHVKDGDSPTMRLEQDGSSGFTAQTWDVAGNETNFFVRDATNGSRLPFKIRPGAPTNSLYIDTDGDIGLGTASPSGRFHVEGGDNDFVVNSDGTANIAGNVGIGTAPNANFRLDLSGGTIPVALNIRDGNPQFRFTKTSGTAQIYGFIIDAGNDFVLRNVTAANADMLSVNTAGDLTVTGNIAKAGGSFKIDHPLDPENKMLYHSFVESPDMMNVYNGNIALDGKGEAIVKMPDYFEALNREFRYQLTSIGAPGPGLYIAEEIGNNQFRIAGGTPGAKVSWQVTGVRKDAWAEQNRIPTEVQKEREFQGFYLHPKVFGQPESRSISAAKNLQLERIQDEN